MSHITQTEAAEPVAAETVEALQTAEPVAAVAAETVAVEASKTEEPVAVETVEPVAAETVAAETVEALKTAEVFLVSVSLSRACVLLVRIVQLHPCSDILYVIRCA